MAIVNTYLMHGVLAEVKAWYPAGFLRAVRCGGRAACAALGINRRALRASSSERAACELQQGRQAREQQLLLPQPLLLGSASLPTHSRPLSGLRSGFMAVYYVWNLLFGFGPLDPPPPYNPPKKAD